EHGLACSIVQHPVVTGIHAVLKEQVACDVVTRRKALWVEVACVVEWVYAVGQWRHNVLHHTVAPRVLHPEWFALGIELSKRDVLLVDQRIGCFHAVVSDSDDIAPEAIENGEARSVVMLRGKPGGPLIGRD